MMKVNGRALTLSTLLISWIWRVNSSRETPSCHFLQRFQFTPRPGVSEDELDLTPAVGFTIRPSPHELVPETGKEPPGPKRLPLLGNLLQLDLQRPYKTLCQLSKKYGSVFTVYFGPKKVVVLAGYKTVKEALISNADEFGDREIAPIFHDINKGHGILFTNGETWKELRRFALTTLRDFGMGKRVAEEKILEECGHLIQMFENHKGEPFNTSRPINYATSNIISSIVYGSRFEYDDPRFKNLVSRANESISLSGSAEIQGIVWELLQQERNETDGSQAIAQLCLNALSTVGRSFIGRGPSSEPSANEEGGESMDQVQEELARVIGGREVQVEDRKNLPYTNAVIHEIQRLANIVPMAIPHKTSQDVTLQGYFIKRGTTVFPLLTSVLYDESEWESPHTFNPSHFLDMEGKFIKRDAFLPFSAGRRVCLGESLAKMELFLFFTSLIQRFQFMPPPGVSEDELDLTPAVGFTIPPSPHELCAVSRHFSLRERRAPPGPRPLPLFGNLFQVDLKRLDQSLFNLSKKYGPVFQVFFGPKKVVVLAGYRTVKQALVNHADEFGNREISPVFDDFTKGHAGTDTTATTLKWCLLYMAKFPHIQERVQEELSRVVGSRQVRTKDRKNLPYTDAVIHESQRLANIVPMALPHAISKDVTFQGYFIKEGTTVFPLLTSVLYDETEWENPHSFSPSHFLDSEGKFIRRDAFMPFSAGRRACLGESLARTELFLFFTSLLQHFHFTPPPGVSEDQLDLTPVVGVTLAPTPQNLCAFHRH
ncbi:hypothetical protein CRENBAI_016965 [Crenichthys baileyi]|uniref:Cytochrome P450 2K1 n=1 Tax=Crenichthys baileyi TaxID=28760 RepID=A0AAV9R690_9TELE